MIRIDGFFYAQGQSSRESARLIFQQDHLILQTAQTEQVIQAADISLQSQVGELAQHIDIAGLGVLESRDHEAIQQLREQLSATRENWIHRLESHKLAVVSLMLFAVLAIAIFIHSGIPQLAKLAAYGLPLQTSQYIGRETLALLDQKVFEPSRLTQSKQEKLRRLFEEKVQPVSSQPLQLHFRYQSRIGANAFALPSGEIIVTDDMVNLAQRPEHLLSVLYHELGHVEARHGLRSILQNSLIGALGFFFVGDVSTANSLIIAMPVFLTEMAYSRQFEEEADRFAVQQLRAQGLDPAIFAEFLRKITEGEGDGVRFLSSHPATEERINRLQQ